MGKKLSEMTLEELWQLFPIVLTEHQDCWKEWYEDEGKTLKSLLPEKTVINHIGSTAIEGIWAKPIVDILVELPDGDDMDAVKECLTHAGYICMNESDGRCDLNKGYTEKGYDERVFHIHLRHAGDNDEIAFRDYLNGHPDVAKEYEVLKLSLWHQYEHDRDGYTAAKSEFVRRVKRLADN